MRAWIFAAALAAGACENNELPEGSTGSGDAGAAARDAMIADASGPDSGDECPIGFDDLITATLRVTADDDRRVVINGAVADELQPARIWSTITTKTVRLFRHPSRENVIAVDARNYLVIDGHDRGLLLDLTLNGMSAPPLITDGRWRVHTGTVAGFEALDFNDRAWDLATEQVIHPGGIWGALFGDSDARWLWIYDSAIPAIQKPMLETVALRRRFYISMNGRFNDKPTTCP